MEDVSLPHAKEHLEELIERARRGEDVRIADAKGGAVRLVPAAGCASRAGRVVFGQWKHLPEIPEEILLEPLSDEDLAWHSGERSPVQ